MSKKDNRKWHVKKLPAGTMLEIHTGYFIGQGKLPGRDDIAYIAAVGQRGKELARLIAAAPDLLAACELVLKNGYRMPCQGQDDGDKIIMRDLTAAIAKAKGK